MFNVSVRTVTNYFHFAVDLLYLALEDNVFWPSRQEIDRCLPVSFAAFPSIRVIVDCSETTVEKPSCDY